MCIALTRRKFILNAGTLAGASIFAGPINLINPEINLAINEKMVSSYASLIGNTLRDKAENPAYLNGSDLSDWHQEIHPLIKSHMANWINHLPTSLPVLELGSYMGDSANILRNTLPNRNIFSFDIFPYYKHERLIIGDIRAEQSTQIQRPFALIWNDISNWKNSPRSKLSAFNFAKKHLVHGGIYIDDRYCDLPNDLDWSGLKLIYKKNYVSVFKKV
jgi:hypothetical protein